MIGTVANEENDILLGNSKAEHKQEKSGAVILVAGNIVATMGVL